jgi:hypothetical protein
MPPADKDWRTTFLNALVVWIDQSRGALSVQRRESESESEGERRGVVLRLGTGIHRACVRMKNHPHEGRK